VLLSQANQSRLFHALRDLNEESGQNGQINGLLVRAESLSRSSDNDGFHL
jgi:hypothetical protein